ncbi:hypothetical protein [Candidatus Magnetominusculus xianensis]|nr:hypothetical protein [Candidatus Magnetominusculus xianensis]
MYSLNTGINPADLNGVFIQLGRTYIDEKAEIPLKKARDLSRSSM